MELEHGISLETRLTNYEGEGEVTIRDLVINSLRMRPDRIIVGEVRGKEAFDMLQAMNTGHNGSLTTLHANSPADALNRLETMILMAGMEIPIKALREYIYNAIDIVVNVQRLSDGKRKITSISEIVGFNDGEIELKEIFAFKQTGIVNEKEVDGEFIRNEYIPKVYNKIVSKGIEMFKNDDNAVLIITHNTRILNHLKVDYVHVLVNGQIVKTSTAELAEQIEETGYAQYKK